MKIFFISFLFIGTLFSSLKEDVGQIIMTYFNGEEANSDSKVLIEDLHVGGIIYYSWANGLCSRQQATKLSSGLQSQAAAAGDPPLLIAVDQEGGRVSRLKGDFLEIPSAQKFGEMNDPNLAFVIFQVIGSEMRKAGINLNFAPVVDVNNNPENIVIGDRSFGNDPRLVTECGRSVARGLLSSKVMPCLKHFPGHGDVGVDSHFNLPIVKKERAELDRVELYPYLELAKEVPFIMTAHILFPELDAKNPSTFSKNILTNLLRNEIGFEGVIITDSLKMKGASNEEMSMAEAAIRAFEAGADMLLIGGKLLLDSDDDNHLEEVRAVQQALIAAVESGRISRERLNESLRRIQKVKSAIH